MFTGSGSGNAGLIYLSLPLKRLPLAFPFLRPAGRIRFLLAWLARLFLVGSLGLGGSRCASPRVHHLRYNPDTRAFEATVSRDSASAREARDWFTIREPKTGTKVTDLVRARTLVTWFNYAATEREKSSFPVRPSTSSFRQYRAARAYFTASDSIQARHYRVALELLKSAARYDPQLAYFSDLNYLRALCWYQLGDSARAERYYSRFTRYTEGLCPAYFHLDLPAGYNHVSRLSWDMCRQGTLDPGHVSFHHTGPALSPRSFPGFIYNPRRRMTCRVEGDVVHTGPNRLKTGLFLKAAWPGRSRPFIGTAVDHQDGMAAAGFDYWFHGSRDNRLGVHGTVRTGLVIHTIPDQENDRYLHYWQTAAGIRAGYFILPRWGVYLGLLFNNWNPQHRLVIFRDYTRYQVYQPHECHLGTVYYFLEYGGLDLRYDLVHGPRVGLFLNGFHFLY